MKMMKIGVIGAGGRGKNAWKAHKPEQGWELAAAMDVKQSALDAFKEQFPNATLYHDYNELLARKDLGEAGRAEKQACSSQQT